MEPDINDQFPAIRIVDLPAVRAVIAREFLNDAQALRGAPEGACRAAASAMAHDRAPRPGTLGSVRLMPHQVEAVERLERAISEFGGGLLCDEVGMGKTFVALALAKMSLRPLVVAPAALRSMWTRASAVAGVPVTVVSFESLSRGARPALQPDFLILDEAHHARNPSTRRYHEAALLALRSPVLMLSATPIHNRRGDLVALLSLFMGSRAHALTDAEVARCVVRRDHKSLGNDSRLPSVEVNSWIDISPEEEILPHVLALPPPVPLRLAGDGGALIVRSLIRQWASSEAALAGGLTRRLRKSEALLHALENGVYPSASEFTAWITSEDSVQLAFPTLVAPPAEAPAELLATVRRHQDALHRALGALGDSRARDRACASEIRAIRRQHEGAKIVAFSQYTDTVISLYGQLVLDGGVAALTSEGATVAGGRIPREEAIARFAPLAAGAPVPARSDEISLLLTTDLLSEGVNLQDAGVVIHLDLPWTPSRINQRTGRVARMGSNHRTVHSYAFRPPAAAAAAIGLESVLRAKARVIQEVVGGAATLLPFADFVHSSPAWSSGNR